MTTYIAHQNTLSDQTLPILKSPHFQNVDQESYEFLPVPVPPIQFQPMGRPMALRRTRLLRTEWWSNLVRRRGGAAVVNQDWTSPRALVSNPKGLGR